MNQSDKKLAPDKNLLNDRNNDSLQEKTAQIPKPDKSDTDVSVGPEENIPEEKQSTEPTDTEITPTESVETSNVTDTVVPESINYDTPAEEKED